MNKELFPEISDEEFARRIRAIFDDQKNRPERNIERQMTLSLVYCNAKEHYAEYCYTADEVCLNKIDIVQGGAVAFICDMASAFTEVSLMDPKQFETKTINTTSFSMEYLSPAKAGDDLILKVRIVHLGSRIMVSKVGVYVKDRLCYTGTVNNMLLPKGPALQEDRPVPPLD